MILEAPPRAESSARSPDRSEAALIRGCREGCEESFRRIVEEYQSRVQYIAYRMVRNEETSREIPQEALIRVFRNISRFDVKKNFHTWLTRITVNLCIDRARLRSRWRTVDIGELGGVADPKRGHPLLRLEWAETRARVEKTPNRMAPKYKVLLALRDIHGFSCREIAHIVGCGNGTVRWRLHRARKLLRAVWEEETGDVEIGGGPELAL